MLSVYLAVVNLKPTKIKGVCCYSLLAGWLLCPNILKSQDITSPRFFKLNVQSLSAPSRLISEEGDALRAGDRESNYIVEGQLRFPIKLSGRTKLIGQVDYDRETVFGLYAENENEGEDFTFNNLSSAIIGIHDIDDQWSYFSRLKVQNGAERLFPFHTKGLNGNFSNFFQKRTKDGLVGIGFQVSYNRRVTVLPVVKWEKRLDNGWGFDISLPQQILINKQFSQSNRWYAGLKGSRSGYFFRDELRDISSDLYYRRITVNAVLGVEKQLTSLIGLMAEVGATRPLRSGVYVYNGPWEKLHDFNEGIAPYVKFGLFLSVNKKSI